MSYLKIIISIALFVGTCTKHQAQQHVYVITNRTQINDSDSIRFANDVRSTSELSYLKSTQDNKFTQLDSSKFLNEASAIEGDWVLFVHGDSKTLPLTIKRGFDIQTLYKVNVIVFSWSSKTPDLNGLKNVKNSWENVHKSTLHFNKVMLLMNAFKDKIPKANLSMFLHSLGNYYIENLFVKESQTILPDNIFDNVVLNSAAVNQEKHKEWLEQLNIQKRIYVTSNRQDYNLKGVRIFTRYGKQLGETIKRHRANNATYIQFTKAIGFRFPTHTTHTYFIGEIPTLSENIKQFYYELMHGKEIDLSNQNLFQKRKDGIGYDIVF